MRSVIVVTIAGAGLLLFGCLGAARGHLKDQQSPLGFEHATERDTADFVHLQFEGIPLSVELVGTASLPTENSYKLLLQVGVYAAPGFDTAQLTVNSDSLHVTSRGLSPVYMSPGYTAWACRPWAAMTVYYLAFDYDSLLARAGDDQFVPLEIRLPHHLAYAGEVVSIDPIRAFGERLKRPGRTERIN